MAKNDAKESARLRKLRIDGSQNGATLRTRIVRDKTKYSRTLKHKKSLADAGDFRYTPLGRACPPYSLKFFLFSSLNVCSDFVLLSGNP